MKTISRRKAMAKFAGGSAGLALMNLTGNALVNGKESEETSLQGSITIQAMPPRAFRGQHQ